MIIRLLKYIFLAIFIALPALIGIIVIIFLLIGVYLSVQENKRKKALQKLYASTHVSETCSVMLVSVGREKISTIITLRKYIDWDLATAKDKIELPLPAIIIYNMPTDLAQKLKTDLEKLDTIVKIQL